MDRGAEAWVSASSALAGTDMPPSQESLVVQAMNSNEVGFDAQPICVAEWDAGQTVPVGAPVHAWLDQSRPARPFAHVSLWCSAVGRFKGGSARRAPAQRGPPRNAHHSG